MRLEPNYSWVEADPGIRTASDRDTLADLELAVAGRVLTLNRSLEADAELEEPRKTIRVSLFPLAEFIAFNWWALLHEPRKTPIDPRAYYRRHQIHRHRDGFAYPHIEFYGAGSGIQVVAHSSQISSAGIEFPTEFGRDEPRILERIATENTLLELIDAVLQRLTDAEDRSALDEAVSAVRRSRADADESEYCTLAGLLGCDPYQPGDDLESTIAAVQSTVGAALSREVFAISELQSAVDNAESISRFAHQKLGKSKAAAEHVAGIKKEFLKRFSRSSAQHASAPWERGYAAANELRRLLSLDVGSPLPTDEVLQRKLMDGAPVESTESFNWQRIGARGLGAEDKEGFGIAIDPYSRLNRRFQLTATFSDYLLSEGDDVFLSTKASTDRQKRNRAFAAEFLVPIQAIRAKLGRRDVVEASDISQICDEFGVSPAIAKHQIENQARDLVLRA